MMSFTPTSGLAAAFALVWCDTSLLLTWATTEAQREPLKFFRSERFSAFPSHLPQPHLSLLL